MPDIKASHVEPTRYGCVQKRQDSSALFSKPWVVLLAFILTAWVGSHPAVILRSSCLILQPISSQLLPPSLACSEMGYD
jgi:hypothetical protein